MGEAKQEGAEVSDAELVARVAERDLDALEALYDRHARVLYSLLLHMVGDRATAETLLHETFWHIWNRAEGYRGRRAVRAWINRVGRQKALDHLRRHNGRGPGAARRADDQSAAASRDTRAAEPRARPGAREGLDRIPEEQWFYLEMAYFEGKSQRDIALETNTPLGTVKTRLRLGLEKLERFLRAVGYQTDDAG